MKYSTESEIEFLLTVTALYHSQEFSDLAREDIERLGTSKAKRIVRDSIADTLEAISDGTEEQRARLDGVLSAKELPPVEYMSTKYVAYYKKILKSGVVRGESDILLLRAALESELLSADEKILVHSLIEKYI